MVESRRYPTIRSTGAAASAFVIKPLRLLDRFLVPAAARSTQPFDGHVEGHVDILSEDDQLILRVALATCFTYPRDLDGVPLEDVRLYVNHLIDLYSRHPDAATNSSPSLPQDMASALEFCASQLQDVAPDEARRLRIAQGGEA